MSDIGQESFPIKVAKPIKAPVIQPVKERELVPVKVVRR